MTGEKRNSEYKIPPLPKIRNDKYDLEATILLWNILPKYFTWDDFEVYTALVDHSRSWGYERLSFWSKVGVIVRIEQGKYMKVEGQT